jgi:hypothetical protein
MQQQVVSDNEKQSIPDYMDMQVFMYMWSQLVVPYDLSWDTKELLMVYR